LGVFLVEKKQYGSCLLVEKRQYIYSLCLLLFAALAGRALLAVAFGVALALSVSELLFGNLGAHAKDRSGLLQPLLKVPAKEILRVLTHGGSG
jgi:hypothetical protein